MELQFLELSQSHPAPVLESFKSACGMCTPHLRTTSVHTAPSKHGANVSDGEKHLCIYLIQSLFALLPAKLQLLVGLHQLLDLLTWKQQLKAIRDRTEVGTHQ